MPARLLVLAGAVAGLAIGPAAGSALAATDAPPPCPVLDGVTVAAPVTVTAPVTVSDLLDVGTGPLPTPPVLTNLL